MQDGDKVTHERSPAAIAAEREVSASEVEGLITKRFQRGLARFDDIAITFASPGEAPLVADMEIRRDHVFRLDPQASRTDEWDSASFLAALRTVPVHCRVHHSPDLYGRREASIDGTTQRHHDLEVVVPEHYAHALDEVRVLRLKAEAAPSEASNCAALAQHALRRRALPEDVMSVVAALPYSIDLQIYLLEEESPQTSWERKFGAMTRRDRARIDSRQLQTITPLAQLHQRDVDHLRSELFRCWAYGHIVHAGNKPETLYRAALKLESANPLAPEQEEITALWVDDLALVMMGYSGADLLNFCLAAPIRATVIAAALRAALDWWVARGNLNAQLRARTQTIEEEFVPLARARLVEIATSEADERVANLAVVALLFLGTTQDLQRLGHVETLHAPWPIRFRIEQVERIHHLSNLKHLDLRGTELRGNCDLPYYLRGLQLETLVLRGTGIVGNELRVLGHHAKSLRSLDVSCTELTDEAVPILADMNLDSLNVSGTRMTDEAKQSLQARMPRTNIGV